LSGKRFIPCCRPRFRSFRSRTSSCFPTSSCLFTSSSRAIARWWRMR
jgi:hypothetical protein